MSWLRELANIEVSVPQLEQAFTDAGLHVERIDEPASAISGHVVVGHVLDFVDEPQKNGKVIRWCHVDVGLHNPPGEPGRGIVCGAHNFKAGDYVPVVLAGSVLPGGVEIAARFTYSHVSDGMICSERELGLGDDHDGIIVMPPAPVGSDALELLGARDAIFDIDVTPDEGHCLSIRGLAREAAQVAGGAFTDPYALPVPPESDAGYPVVLESPACQLFSLVRVDGIDPEAKTPSWMARRLKACGMRPIALPVDITNYVMLESGQPLHGYDAKSLRGPIVVRTAREGEKLTTLDQVQRVLSADDLLITDGSGPIGLAGVMGGLTTEMEPTTTDVLIEAAWFDPASIGRTYRRHHLPSEASRRFERGVDMNVAFAAATMAAKMLRDFGGGVIREQYTVTGAVLPMPQQVLGLDLASQILGYPVDEATLVAVLQASGVSVERDGTQLKLTPPTWRRDLIDPYDYVEEVGRKLGFTAIPSRVPRAPSGRGYTPRQRANRAVTEAVVAMGLTEVMSLPFIGTPDLDKLGLPATDGRRAVVRLANPLSDAQPYLRTTLLPGLLAAVNRNTSRSNTDLALFEVGPVFLETGAGPAISPPVDQRPNRGQIDRLFADLPDQPRHLGAVLVGDWLPARWQAPAEPVRWAHAAAVAYTVADAMGLVLVRRAAKMAPWHPGRCAELGVATWHGFMPVGFAGELHPTVLHDWGVPGSAVAVELDLDALLACVPDVATPGIAVMSTHPAVKQDVALVVDVDVPSAAVADALRAGAGELLESLSLFDVFTGAQLGPGKKSLAYSMVFRAPDRTLTEAQASAARDQAVAAASALGAVLRS